MITKYKIFESIKDDYPHVNTIDLLDVGSRYDIPGDDYDYRGFEGRLKRLLLNNYCEFTSESGYGEPGGKIEGVITDVDVENWFDQDIFLHFYIDDKKYTVYIYEPITVYSKEKKEPPKIDLKIDPYLEEEWDD